MDIFEIRRLNLIKLIEDRCNGKDASFATTIERDPSYISRCKYPEGKKHKKRISDTLIGVINEKFDLPIGWMDTLDHSTVEYSAGDKNKPNKVQQGVVNQYGSNDGFQQYAAALSSQAEINQAHELMRNFVELPQEYKKEVLAIVNRIHQLSSGERES